MKPDAKEPLAECQGCLCKRKSRTSREEVLKCLSVEEFSCNIDPDDMFCGQRGCVLRKIGYVKARDKPAY